MNKWNELFNEQAPESLNNQTLSAVRIELDKIKTQKRRQVFINWGSFFATGSLAAYAGFLILKSKNPANMDFGELELTQFTQLEEQDVDLLADSDADLDLLENLDILEDLEEDV